MNWVFPRIVRWLVLPAFFWALFSSPLLAKSTHKSLQEWLIFQNEKSKEFLFRNISPNGAAKGAVIASPSRSLPDYYYHWVRDAGLTMNVVLDLLLTEPKASYLISLTDYLRFSRQNQLTQNPSEEFQNPPLGEPKFHADGSAFTQNWMRPQNDGPAIRSMTLIRFAEVLLKDKNNQTIVKEIYDSEIPTQSVVKMDLEFISKVWDDETFDLWEECKGHHFYTRMVQYRALTEGAKLAETLADKNAAKHYRDIAKLIARALQDHWDSDRGLLRENFPENCRGKNTGLDTATILAVLHTQGNDGLFSISDERVLATAYELEEAFKKEYPINQTQFQNKLLGTAIGRYPNDHYDGVGFSEGNPWVLTTFAFAEYYYALAEYYLSKGKILITPQSHKFFQSLVDKPLEAHTSFMTDSEAFQGIVEALLKKGESFVERNRFHGFDTGSFSEQIHRSTGHMRGAADLTWNYASFLSMKAQRDRVLND